MSELRLSIICSACDQQAANLKICVVEREGEPVIDTKTDVTGQDRNLAKKPVGSNLPPRIAEMVEFIERTFNTSGTGVRAPDIMAKFGVSQPTAYRMIKTAKKAGMTRKRGWGTYVPDPHSNGRARRQ